MNKKNTIMVFAVVASLAACNSATKKQEAEVDHQVKEQPLANSPEKIAERASEAFTSAPGLSENQRQKLMLIYLRTYSDAISIRNEIGQSKSLLFKKVADVDYKSNEVEILKKKIVALDQKRMKLMFKALADVQDVVGYGKDKEQIYKHFYDFEVPHGAVGRQ